MARVKPEVLYEPLAPLIADARKRGLSDDEILERLERAKGQAREMGYSGQEIMGLHSQEIKEESRAKTFFRGIAEGLTVGFYIPDFLKNKPSEIPQSIPVGFGTEVNPEPLGEMAGGIVPFTGLGPIPGALRIAKPVVAPLAQRAFGTGRAGRIATEAGTMGAASGAIEGLHSGGDVESTALATGIGMGLGGAAGAAREIAMARMAVKKPPPSEVIIEADGYVLPGRVGQPKTLPAERIGERGGTKALPSRSTAIPMPGEVPIEPIQGELPIRGAPDAGRGAQLKLFSDKVAREVEADAATVRTPKKPAPETPPPAATPPDKPGPQEPAPAVRLTVTHGKKTWKYERASQAEVDQLEQTIRETVDPAVVKGMKFDVTRTGKAVPKARKVSVEERAREAGVPVETLRAYEQNAGLYTEPGSVIEQPKGLRPKAGAPAESVRLPSETDVPTVAELLDRKGQVFRVDHSDKQRPYMIIGEGGEVKRFPHLHDAINFADHLADDVPASTVAKAIRGEALSAAETKSLRGARGRRKVANQPLAVDETPPGIPPDPPPAPPPIAPPDPMMGTMGGPGAQLSLPDWMRATVRSRGMSDAEGTRLASSVTDIAGRYPMLEAEIRAGFENPRMMSWNPTDFFGQPQSARNTVIRTASRETAEVEMAWDFEAKKWHEYFTKHFAHLDDKEAAQAARLVEGELKPTQVSERVQQAATAWKTASEDFAKRLGLPEWSEYLTRLTDMQGVYESWRPHLMAARKFDDLSETLQFKIGSERVWNIMRKAVEKQEKWETLPHDVKDWFKTRLLDWSDSAGWESIPDFVRARMPREVFDRFLLPRTGGLPYERDIRKSFQAYVPIALKKLHVDSLIDRWEPLANHLPGSATHPLAEGYYLRKYLTRFAGRDSVGLDKIVDGVVRSVENSLGKSLADPNIASRLASRAAAWTYRGALGLDSAVINTTQSLNTWAQSGSTPFLKGLGRFIAGEGKSRPDVGVLREFSDIYTKGEFVTKGEKLGAGWTQKLADIDDKVTKLALSPMGLAENVNRGVSFLTAMEEAAAIGLDATQALKLGWGKASRVVPNLELTRAQLESVHKTAAAQFAYSPAYRTPYFAGPLARLSTIFWSYPTRQTQFMTNNVAEGVHSVLRQPNFDNSSRLLRFTALLGLAVGGAAMGAKIGLNLENIYGLKGMFPRAFAGPIGLVVQGYNMSTTGRPVRQEDIDRLWSNSMTALIPQHRYGKKVLWGEDSVVAAAQRGYRTDELGRQTYRTTPYGELMRALGVEYGQSYRERVAVRAILEDNAKRLDERRGALSAAIGGDFGIAEKYNERYPDAPLTERDLRAEIKLRETPLIQRTGPMFLRHRAMESLEGDDEHESDGGVKP